MKRAPLVVAAVLSFAYQARAETKYNAALTPALGYHRGALGFDLSAVGAAMFLETHSRAVGVGPRLEVGSFNFETLRMMAGPELHVPIDPLTLGLSAHLGAKRERGDFNFGFGARALLGLRPYNHYGSYTATGGLVLGIDHWVGSGTSVSLGAQLDAMWLSVPFFAFAELFRG